jgi:hypothetical protein
MSVRLSSGRLAGCALAPLLVALFLAACQPAPEIDPPALYFHTATVTERGHVVVIGGMDLRSSQPTAKAFVFSERHLRFTREIDLPAAVWGHTATALAGVRILVAGESAMILELGRDRAELIPGPITPRVLAGAARLRDGRVLFIGGRTPDVNRRSVREAEIFDPGTGRFRPSGSSHFEHLAPSVIVTAGGQVLVMSSTGIERFDPDNETFHVLSAPGLPSRASVVQSGAHVLVVGGAGHERCRSVGPYGWSAEVARQAEPSPCRGGFGS